LSDAGDDKDEQRPSLTGGARFIHVPADPMQDNRLSLGARWLYAVLAGYADKDGNTIPVSLRGIADREGCSYRGLLNWVDELEAGGLITRIGKPGLKAQFHVERNASKFDAVRARNLSIVVARKVKFSPYGKAGAEAKRMKRVTSLHETEAPSKGDGIPHAEPVNPHSPPSEPTFTGTGEPTFAHTVLKDQNLASGDTEGTVAAARCATPGGSASGGSLAAKPEPIGSIKPTYKSLNRIQGARAAVSAPKMGTPGLRRLTDELKVDDYGRTDGLGHLSPEERMAYWMHQMSGGTG
jgi:hypothetical protein